MGRAEAAGPAGASDPARDTEQPRQPGPGCGARGEPGPPEARRPWKKFLYCEPHKRIKEVREEELSMKRDDRHVTRPPAVALDGIWSFKRDLPAGGLKPAPGRNSLLPQAKFYSRHGGLRR